MTTRVSFELKYQAANIFNAKEKAVKYFSEFLRIPLEDVEDKVSLELKVDLHKFEKDELIDLDIFYDITAHGQVKSGFIFTPTA